MQGPRLLMDCSQVLFGVFWIQVATGAWLGCNGSLRLCLRHMYFQVNDLDPVCPCLGLEGHPVPRALDL